MNNLTHNILWIDDEHQTFGGTKGRAKRNGINLIGFKSLNGGLSELKRNYPFYDGVLLDAKIFENEDDVEGTEDTKHLHRAKDQILQLPKKFKIFVLTGQAKKYEDETFNNAFENVYKKGSDDEIDRLFTDIKEAAVGQEDTQLRHSYQRVFDVCTARYIGEHAGQDILTLLKIKDGIYVEDHFNTIRKVLEDLFSAFNTHKLLPDVFVNPIALNPSSIFLSGKKHDDSRYNKFKHLPETHLPKQIGNYLRNILSVTQPGSHRTEIDRHVKEIKTPFLIKSVLYQLLDVLVWFKMYVDSNPTTENWECPEIQNGESILGSVINLHDQKGFAFFKPDTPGENVYIHPRFVNEFSLQNGMQIMAEVESYVDNRTGDQKTRVKQVKVV